jgi:hypothetical protein
MLSHPQEVEELKRRKREAENPSTLAEAARGLVDTYLVPGANTEVNISDRLRKRIVTTAAARRDAKDDDISPAMLEAFEEAQNEALKLMALGAFPRFLMSATFQEWRSSQAKAAGDVISKHRSFRGDRSERKGSIGDDDRDDDPKCGGRRRGGGGKKGDDDDEEEEEEAELKAGALAAKKLDSLLLSTHWLQSFLESVEHLPVCVSLAAAYKDSFGFVSTVCLIQLPHHCI